MKYLMVIFSILAFNFMKADIKEPTKKSPIEVKIDSLENRIKKLDESSYSKSIIQEYKDLNNIYSIGFGILIGLFGIVFPLLLYLVQIRPGQEVLKESKQLIRKIEEDFEKSFEEYLKKSKIKLVNQALESFENRTQEVLPTNYTLLETYKSEGFTEAQVLRIIKLLKRDDIESGDKDFLATLLNYQEDDFIEDYFTELIKNDPADKKCIWGALYFANYQKTQYYDLIARIVIAGYPIGGMIASLSSVSKNFALQLLNNELLTKELSGTEIKSYGDYGIKSLKEKVSSESVESTLFWKKYVSLS